MKKVFALFLCLVYLLLTACGHSTPVNDVSMTDMSEQTQQEEPFTSEPLLSANDHYGSLTVIDSLSVLDDSILYRTDDSFKLEPTAIRASQDMLKKSLAQPDSMQIKNCSVWNCVDDGDCTYYNVYFSASYLVATGERLESGFSYVVGVQKKDKTAFDAYEQIDRVTEAYSVFADAERNAVQKSCRDEESFFVSAAEKIAISRLKHPQSGKVLSTEKRLSTSDDTVSAWDVLCEGENDFGMVIPDVYTVYLRFVDGKILEVDPADSDADVF